MAATSEHCSILKTCGHYKCKNTIFCPPRQHPFYLCKFHKCPNCGKDKSSCNKYCQSCTTPNTNTVLSLHCGMCGKSPTSSSCKENCPYTELKSGEFTGVGVQCARAGCVLMVCMPDGRMRGFCSDKHMCPKCKLEKSSGQKLCSHCTYQDTKNANEEIAEMMKRIKNYRLEQIRQETADLRKQLEELRCGICARRFGSEHCKCSGYRVNLADEKLCVQLTCDRSGCKTTVAAPDRNTKVFCIEHTCFGRVEGKCEREKSSLQTLCKGCVHGVSKN